jgi:hypothetical protein
MQGQDIHVNIDPLEMLAPLIAAQLTNILYTKALLRQLEGKPVTNFMDAEFLDNVITNWTTTWEVLVSVIEERKKQRPSNA